MDVVTGYETPLLALVPTVEATTDRENDCAQELAQDWEREMQALTRRLRLRLVRGAQQDEGHLSVA